MAAFITINDNLVNLNSITFVQCIGTTDKDEDLVKINFIGGTNLLVRTSYAGLCERIKNCSN